MRTRATVDCFPRERDAPPRFRPVVLLRAVALRADDFLVDDLRADDLRAGDFLPEDLRPVELRRDDFLADDFLAELERRLPPDLRPPDFLDVAMKRLRK